MSSAAGFKSYYSCCIVGCCCPTIFLCQRIFLLLIGMYSCTEACMYCQYLSIFVSILNKNIKCGFLYYLQYCNFQYRVLKFFVLCKFHIGIKMHRSTWEYFRCKCYCFTHFIGHNFSDTATVGKPNIPYV